MSRFYGQVISDIAQTNATRRASEDIKVSCQSWNGSVISKMYYDKKDELIIEIYIDDGSSSTGDLYFKGNLEKLKEKLL